MKRWGAREQGAGVQIHPQGFAVSLSVRLNFDRLSCRAHAEVRTEWGFNKGETEQRGLTIRGRGFYRRTAGETLFPLAPVRLSAHVEACTLPPCLL